jgi:hypothetical protein
MSEPFIRSSHDLLRRFTLTPFVSDLVAMGKTIRLETNSSTIQEAVLHAMACYEGIPSGHSEFLWRIVGEASLDSKTSWPEMTVACDAGLYCINLGQRSFLAIDLKAQEAVGFLAEDLVRDEAGFKWPVLATLFSISARALRLTALCAACVALDEKGVLILGPPKSGKTTAGYLAERLGLQFHADHITFLECEGHRLGAWGEFWPVVFHAETLEFLPELSATALPFRYCHQPYLHLEKTRSSTVVHHRVTPVACVFLSRQKAEAARIVPLDAVGCAARLKANFLFGEDDSLEPRRNAVWSALSRLPAYTLDYRSDPAEAVDAFAALLRGERPSDAEV